jgi:hypothetical protein
MTEDPHDSAMSLKMKNALCELEYNVLPAGAEGQTKIISIPLVPVIIVVLATTNPQ